MHKEITEIYYNNEHYKMKALCSLTRLIPVTEYHDQLIQ